MSRRFGERTRLTNAASTAQVTNWFGNQFVVAGISVEYLVVAGGGAGGYDRGSGGGAGGYRSSISGESSGGGASAELPLIVSRSTNYSVTIGAGGATVTGYSVFNNGVNSSFATITSIGGGAGTNQGTNAFSGGSGGGCESVQNATKPGGAGTVGQGYAGGGDLVNVYHGTGGGGGAGAIGGAPGANNGTGGNGGIGVASSVTGSSVYRAGGGGGGAAMDFNAPRAGGSGGTGGGGAGGNTNGQSGTAGTVNTGGGGGGGANISQGNGGAGGSGVVILRYDSAYTITVDAGLTSSTVTIGLNKVTTITAGTGNVSWA